MLMMAVKGMGNDSQAIRDDVHTQVVTDNGKRPFGGVGVLHQRVISMTKWHYRNNEAKILIMYGSFILTENF